MINIKRGAKMLLITLSATMLLTGCSLVKNDPIKAYKKNLVKIEKENTIKENYSYRINYEGDDLKEDTEFLFGVITDKKRDISEGSLSIVLNDESNSYVVHGKGDSYFIKIPDEEKYMEFDKNNDLLNTPSREMFEEVLDVVEKDEELSGNLKITEKNNGMVITTEIPMDKVVGIMEKVVSQNISFDDLKEQTVRSVKKEVDKLNRDLNLKITDADITTLVDEELKVVETSYDNLLANLVYSPLVYEIQFNKQSGSFIEKLYFNVQFENTKINFEIKYSYEGDSTMKLEDPNINKENILKEHDGLNLLLDHLS